MNMWYQKFLKTASAQDEIKHYPLNINIPPLITNVLQSLKDAGYPALLVGGAVRDAIMGAVSSDLDFEVYGLSMEQLAQFLSKFGFAKETGQMHGVIQFVGADGSEADFGVPRRDNKTGVKHTDFKAELDPTMTPKQGAARRDFTINSMAYDPFTEELYDYAWPGDDGQIHRGTEDLQNGILRVSLNI